MKRYTSAILLTLSVVVGATPIANAVITPGSKCSKAGMEKTDNGKVYTCIKSGSKLVWSKGVKAYLYDAVFAQTFLSQAKNNASQILADAKKKADQISSPPICTTGGSRAVASIGTDQFGLSALVFENSGICELVVRASASFICPDGGTTKLYNSITSSGTFSLKASEKLFVSANVAYFFPQVLTDCRLLTGYTANIVSLNPLQYPPSVIVLSSRYSGVFNQVEATEKANQFIASEKARADKIIADAKNPALIEKAWKSLLELKAAEEIYKAEEVLKAAAEKAAAEKAAAEKAAAEKAVVDERGKICLVESSCKVGNIGPGGGVVFYDAGNQQSWGRYLEVAPSGWSGSALDPLLTWCNLSYSFSTRSEAIGSGEANTDLIIAGCSSGAAVAARQYKGGGKSDWSLPSMEELNQLYKYIKSPDSGNLRQGLLEHVYFSSTSTNPNEIWYQSFLGGRRDFGNWVTPLYVRPVRSF